MPNKPEYIILHHTGGTDAQPLADTSHHTFDGVDAWHKQLWNFKSSLGHYIGYHYFIEKNGALTQGRADTDTGAHTRGWNDKSIGICLAGNFDRPKDQPNHFPTDRQINTLKNLLEKLRAEYDIKHDKIVPHRFFANKTCYGTNIPDNWDEELLKPSDDDDAKEIERLKAERDKLIRQVQRAILRLIAILRERRKH